MFYLVVISIFRLLHIVALIIARTDVFIKAKTCVSAKPNHPETTRSIEQRHAGVLSLQLYYQISSFSESGAITDPIAVA